VIFLFSNYIEERTINIANYIIDQGATVRHAAKIFGISKSTIHKDMVERLPAINKSLSHDVRIVLEKNLSERHIRGGEATRKKHQSHT
jgi:putative DeoR family transcriptional regulator (stage III sporulation protein D)